MKSWKEKADELPGLPERFRRGAAALDAIDADLLRLNAMLAADVAKADMDEDERAHLLFAYVAKLAEVEAMRGDIIARMRSAIAVALAITEHENEQNARSGGRSAQNT